VVRVTPLKALEQEVAALPKRQRERVEKRISAIGLALIEDPEALAEGDSVAELEARNLKRVLAVWRRVLAESLAANELTQLELSRQQLKNLRDQGKLIGLQPPLRKGFVYPAWQFDPETGRPFAALPKIVKTAKEASLDGLDLHLLMTSTAAEEGRSPSQWLGSGDVDYVLGLIRGSGDVGS
jgi:hypothetical protein